MRNKEVEDFYQSALNYCSKIEGFDSSKDTNKLKSLLLALLDLYSKALHLPTVAGEDDRSPSFKISTPPITFEKYDHYWEVFDPYHLEEPVGSSLTDDISEIYLDVKHGLKLYDEKQYSQAIWEWTNSFEIHWGSHAVDSIRALHSALNRKKTECINDGFDIPQ